ncbi:gamma-glutamyltranspeptidase [Pseudomonas silensiensis]|nr:gamma-glutamyltranspeptidase [Pseudomonas silensiensis]
MKFEPFAKSLIATSLALSCLSAYAASVAPVAAENGMVVTAQHLASHVGVDVLKNGGNAVDAAVAVGYALAVVYPAAGNLGGGGFMTVQLADGRKTFLDFREKAPLAATADMYLDKEGNVVPDLSTRGHLAVGVPGTVSGMELALKKYGTKPRKEVIAPAIKLAEDGFVLEQGDVELLEYATDVFKKDIKDSGAIFLSNGEPMQVGQKLVQKDLAKTLREISEKGEDGFYKGWVADAIVTSSQANKGIITQADLDKYKTRELAPIECDYRGYHVVSAPPPSSGGVVICEIMNILEGYPMKDLGYHSAQGMHYQIEAMRHAYVDRNSYLGDPDFVKNPIEHLLDKNYATKIRAAINPQKAGVSRELKPGVAPHEGSNTTHYSIVDKWGNAVSVTYTLNDWFGAACDGQQNRGHPQRRNGRLHLENRRAQHVRPGARRSQRHCARQGTAVVHEPDHRHQGRQSGHGCRHPRRQSHHHRHLADHAQRDRLRHEHPGSGRCAPFPPAMAAGRDQPGDLHHQSGHGEDA